MKTKFFFLSISGIITTLAIPVFTVISCSDQQVVKTKIKVALTADAKKVLEDLKTSSKTTNNNEFVTWLSASENKNQVDKLFDFSPAIAGENIDKLDINYSVVVAGANAKFSLEVASSNFELNSAEFLIKLPNIKKPIEVIVNQKDDAETKLAQFKTSSKTTNNNEFVTWLSASENKNQVDKLFDFSPAIAGENIDKLDINYIVVVDGANAKFSLEVTSSNFKLNSAEFLIKLPNDKPSNNKTKVSVSLVDYAAKKLNELKPQNGKDFIAWLNNEQNKTKIKDLFIFKSTNNGENINGFDASFTAKKSQDNKNIEFTISPIGDFELDKPDFLIPLLEIGSYVVGLEFIGNWESNPSQTNQSIYLKLKPASGLHTLGSKNNWLTQTDPSNPKDGLGIMLVPSLDSIKNEKMTAGIYKTENSTTMTTVDIDINQIFKSDWDILTKNMLYAETNPSKSIPVLAKKAESSNNFTKFFITKHRTYFYDIKK